MGLFSDHKIEIGVIVTVTLAIIGFAFWLGGINHQVSTNTEEIKSFKQTFLGGGVKTRNYVGAELSDMHNRRQFQFMTPSVETWKAKQDYYEKIPDYKNGQDFRLESLKWQQVDNSKIEEFGRLLISEGFTQGWRYYPYTGQGRYRDTGLWWVMTVGDSFNVDRFVKFYLRYWGTNEIYLEEFQNSGDVMPDKFIPNPNLPVKKH